MTDPRRENLFMELVQEKIRLVSLTPKEAALSPWDDVKSHKAFAKIGLALLREEVKVSVITQFDGPLIEFDDGLRSRR